MRTACVARGWGVAQLDDEVGRELSSSTEKPCSSGLSPLVGAEGVGIARVFNNDATRAEVTMFAQPEELDEFSLSVRSQLARTTVTSDLGPPSLWLNQLFFPSAREIVV